MKEQASSLGMLAFAGVLNAAGQVTMRWGGRGAKVPFSLHHLPDWALSSRWWLLGLLITWSSGLFWAVLLRSVRLGIALPLFAGTSYVLTVVASVVILAERPTTSQYVGMLFVMIGVLLIVIRK